MTGHGHAPAQLIWVGSSLRDVRAFPEEVRHVVGFALCLAQAGGKHVSAKPLRGFGDAAVLEVVADHAGDTFRAVYTVRFEHVVYVLHAFQKRSKKGVAMPQRDARLIRERLLQASRIHTACQCPVGGGREA